MEARRECQIQKDECRIRSAFHSSFRILTSAFARSPCLRGFYETTLEGESLCQQASSGVETPSIVATIVAPPARATPIGVVGASTLTVTFDQPVSLNGVPQYKAANGAIPTAASLSAQNTLLLPYPVGAVRPFTVPFDDAAIRNTSGGFVVPGTVPSTAFAAVVADAGIRAADGSVNPIRAA